MLGLDIQLSALTENFADKELGYNGYPVMLDQEGVAIVHPSMRGESLVNLPFIEEMYGEEEYDGVVYYSHEGTDRVIIYTTIPEFNWKIGAVYDMANINATASETQRAMIIIALITLVVFCIVLYILISRMMRPIQTLNALMDSVSQGDLTVRSDIKTNDEIGELGLISI